MNTTSPSDAEPVASSRRLSRRLRRERLKVEKLAAPLSGVPERPDVFYDFYPGGSYPIIALRTVPCDKWMQGSCAPCGYSARAYPRGTTRKQLYEGLHGQLEWLLNNFDDEFVARGNGRLNEYGLREAPDRPWYMLQIAGESSFFRDAEIPPDDRRKLLERLVSFQDERGVNLHVMVECRAEHLTAAEDSGELNDLAPLMKALDVVVNLGWESADEWNRNHAFAKDLDGDAFSRALNVSVKHDLDPGVFVFFGSHLSTTAEALSDIDKSLKYLEASGVFANLMVPNLQSFTVPDMLYQSGYYSLPEPWVLLDIAERLLRHRPTRAHRVTPFDWFLGGLETDPAPRHTLLDHPLRRTSEKITAQIHESLLNLVTTLDAAKFEAEVTRLRSHPEFRFHVEDLARTDSRSQRERLVDANKACEQTMPEYLANVRRVA